MSRTSKSETPEPFVIATAEPQRPSARAILLAGVAGACVLGVGLGLWARPEMHERRAALAAHGPAAAAPAISAARQLEIVVADHARLIGEPLEVLPPGRNLPPPASVRPADGLIRARDPVPPAAAHETPSLRTILPGVAAAVTGARLTLAKLERAAPIHGLAASPAPLDDRIELVKAQARQLEIARADAAKAEAHRAALAKAEFEDAQAAKAAAARVAAEQAKVGQAKAEAAAKAEARRIELARAQAQKAAAAKAEAHRIALAKAEAQKNEAARVEAHRLALARADAQKAMAAKAARRAELAREARAEKAEKVEQIRLAKAQAKARAAQREEARLEALADAAEANKRAQLARLARAMVRAVVPHERATTQGRPGSVELAKADRRHVPPAHDGKVQKVAARKPHDPPPRLIIVRPPRAQPMAPQPDDGLVRVSTSPRCASRDPGAALVCADPALSAADRQLARAYQSARAAGVPDGELQRGQQRWLSARAAAAREAPWAVRDVYMARIAELNSQAKEAQGGY